MSKDKDALKTTVLARFAGGNIFTPKVSDDDDSKGEKYFSACLILDKNEDKKIRKIYQEAVTQKFGDKAPKLDDWTIREGDDEEYEHSFGALFVNPKCNKPPKLLIKRNGALHNVLESDDIIYPGCYVAASVHTFIYDKNLARNVKRPGVSLSLRALMFVRHGERLSDIVDAETEFNDYESEIEEEEDGDIPF